MIIGLHPAFDQVVSLSTADWASSASLIMVSRAEGLPVRGDCCPDRCNLTRADGPGHPNKGSVQLHAQPHLWISPANVQ